MPSPFRTTIGQFSSAGGRPQPRAVNVRAVEPAADLSGAQRGNLYLLVEVSGSGGGQAALYRQLLNAAQTAFYEAEGTLASALVRAVRNAHAVLRRANEALPEADWRAGITCVAVHDQELTVAQAGRALVLIAHPKTVDMFPDSPADFSTPLGGDERPEVQLVRTAIEPGSTLLLAQSQWLERVPAERLASATTLENVGQVIDYLGQLAGDADLSALVVGIAKAMPEVQDSTPGLVAPKAAPAKAAPSSAAPAKAVPPKAAMPAPTEAASGAGQAHRPLVPGPAPIAPADNGADESAVVVTTPVPGTAAGPTRAWELSEEEAAQAIEVAPEEPGINVEAAPVEAEEIPRRSLWPLIIAVVVIPLLIALLVLAMMYWRNQTNETQFRDLLTGASAAAAEAAGLPDEASARLRLGAARDLLDRARAIKPNDQRLTEVQFKYDENMDRLNHVTPLYGVVPLWDFKGTGHKLDRLVVNGNSLFVLDRGLQAVDQFVLSELGDSVKPADAAVVISKTQRIKDQVVGDLIDITWAEAVKNQHSRLLALDTANGLIGYDVTWGTAKVPLTGRDQWGYAELLASYSGNLYVIDTKANQIWRYRPSDDGYENAPEPYFATGQEVDLAGVRSLAIDGNIWLLYADGRLLKFFAGEHKAFELTGLADPLVAPMAVAASREGDQLYIADAGSGTNGRIVEFDKNGKFLRQFRPAQAQAFQDMRSIYLDEGTRQFYILAGDRLYKADLPSAE